MKNLNIFQLFVVVLGWAATVNQANSKFHRIHVYSVDQALVSEDAKELGETSPGEKRTVHFYITNHTLADLNIESAPSGLSEWKLQSPVRIPPLERGLISGTVVIGKLSKDLDRPLSVGFHLTKECRLLTSLTHKSAGFAAAEKEHTTVVVYESQLATREPTTVEIPLTVSDDQVVERLSVQLDPALSMVTAKPRMSNGRPVIQASFHPSVIDRSTISGVISIENTQKTSRTQSLLSIRIRRDIAIVPEKVVFRKTHGKPEYVGECLLQCNSSAIRIDDLKLQCELSNNDKVTCDIKRISDNTARVYLRISSTSSKSPHKEDILINVSHGQIDRDLFVNCLVPP
jgi:hypothetical protein